MKSSKECDLKKKNLIYNKNEDQKITKKTNIVYSPRKTNVEIDLESFSAVRYHNQ